MRLFKEIVRVREEELRRIAFRHQHKKKGGNGGGKNAQGQ